MTENQFSYFEKIPKVNFFFRMVIPVVLVGLGMSFLIQQNVPEQDVQFWKENLFHIPRICEAGAVSDFDKKQCSDFWLSLGGSLFYTFSPVLSAILFFIFIWNRFIFFHKKLQTQLKKSIQTAKPIEFHMGKNSALSIDLFSWFYCFRYRLVDLKDTYQPRPEGLSPALSAGAPARQPKKQGSSPADIGKVYFPLEGPIPFEGQDLVVLQGGPQDPKKGQRRFGILYAPHVAVIRGS